MVDLGTLGGCRAAPTRERRRPGRRLQHHGHRGIARVLVDAGGRHGRPRHPRRHARATPRGERGGPGRRRRAPPPTARTHAFSWTQSGGMVDLGTLGGTTAYADAVNDAGQVVGQSSTRRPASTHAFSWTEAGGMVDLGTLGGTTAARYAVNDNGQVVGASATTAGRQRVTTRSSGRSRAAWSTSAPSVAARATRNAMNDAGQVVGGSNIAAGADLARRSCGRRRAAWSTSAASAASMSAAERGERGRSGRRVRLDDVRRQRLSRLLVDAGRRHDRPRHAGRPDELGEQHQRQGLDRRVRAPRRRPQHAVLWRSVQAPAAPGQPDLATASDSGDVEHRQRHERHVPDLGRNGRAGVDDHAVPRLDRGRHGRREHDDRQLVDHRPRRRATARSPTARPRPTRPGTSRPRSAALTVTVDTVAPALDVGSEAGTGPASRFRRPAGSSAVLAPSDPDAGSPRPTTPGRRRDGRRSTGAYVSRRAQPTRQATRSRRRARYTVVGRASGSGRRGRRERSRRRRRRPHR